MRSDASYPLASGRRDAARVAPVLEPSVIAGRVGATQLRRSIVSILVRFTGAPNMSSDLYDKAMPEIEASGQFPPDGLEYHVAFESGGAFRVSEIWDSKEQFEAFGQRLMPILEANGIELAGPPEIVEVYNTITR
jgi:hypothetical protein